MQSRVRVARRIAVIAVSAGMSMALVGGIGGPGTEWSARAARHAVLPVAAIVESPGTIGVAEGHDFYLMSETDIERTLDAMQSLGVKNVRIGIFWADVEAEEGVFKWENIDRMVEAADRRGMGILGTVLYTPPWAGAAQPPEETAWISHPDPVKFGTFVSEVAEKYSGRISAYEIWNEPTANLFWDPVDPAAYTRMLQEGYEAIKLADPSAVVIAGSVVAGPTRPDGSTMSPVDFLAGMYDAGAQGYFDAFSYHPYLYSMPFSGGQGQPHFDYPIEQLDQLRALMIEKGDGDIKVWITEYGQPTTTLDGNVVLTQEQQAAFIEDLLRTWQNIDGAGPVFIYQTRDTEPGSLDPDKNLGLFDHDWQPKLAADVLADLIKELRPTTAQPVNPLAAFFQQIVRAVGQAVAFVPKLITQVIKSVANFVGSVLGVGAGKNASSSAVTRSATSEIKTSVMERVSQMDEGRRVSGVNTSSPADAAERVRPFEVPGAQRPEERPDAEPTRARGGDRDDVSFDGGEEDMGEQGPTEIAETADSDVAGVSDEPDRPSAETPSEGRNDEKGLEAEADSQEPAAEREPPAADRPGSRPGATMRSAPRSHVSPAKAPA